MLVRNSQIFETSTIEGDIKDIEEIICKCVCHIGGMLQSTTLGLADHYC